MALHHLGNADGVVDSIYHFLWMKNSEGMSAPGVYIPDTVMYKYTQAAYWYFTSAQDDQIKIKNKGNTTNANIYRSFTKREEATSEICAYYISSQEDEQTGKKFTSIEYLNQQTLHDFLFNREKENNGILQKFVDPKGDNNAIIQAVWLPRFCLLERRVNKRKISDLKVNMYERAVTFEGTEYHSDSVPLNGTALARRIGMICNSMVNHIAAISNNRHQVSRMVLQFKLDEDDRVWLLWCSSLRLFNEGDPDEHTLNLTPTLTVPGDVYLSPTPQLSKPNDSGVGTRSFLCPSCKKKYDLEKKSEGTYQAIIKDHTRRCLKQSIADLAGAQLSAGGRSGPEPDKSDRSAGASHQSLEKRRAQSILGTRTKRLSTEEVPQILRVLHPQLTKQEYGRLRKNPLFLLRTAPLCEDCFLSVTRPEGEAGPATEEEAAALVRIGPALASTLRAQATAAPNATFELPANAVLPATRISEVVGRLAASPAPREGSASRSDLAAVQMLQRKGLSASQQAAMRRALSAPSGEFGLKSRGGPEARPSTRAAPREEGAPRQPGGYRPVTVAAASPGYGLEGASAAREGDPDGWPFDSGDESPRDEGEHSATAGAGAAAAAKPGNPAAAGAGAGAGQAKSFWMETPTPYSQRLPMPGDPKKKGLRVASTGAGPGARHASPPDHREKEAQARAIVDGFDWTRRVYGDAQTAAQAAAELRALRRIASAPLTGHHEPSSSGFGPGPGSGPGGPGAAGAAAEAEALALLGVAPGNVAEAGPGAGYWPNARYDTAEHAAAAARSASPQQRPARAAGGAPAGWTRQGHLPPGATEEDVWLLAQAGHPSGPRLAGDWGKLREGGPAQARSAGRAKGRQLPPMPSGGAPAAAAAGGGGARGPPSRAGRPRDRGALRLARLRDYVASQAAGDDLELPSSARAAELSTGRRSEPGGGEGEEEAAAAFDGDDGRPTTAAVGSRGTRTAGGAGKVSAAGGSGGAGLEARRSVESDGVRYSMDFEEAEASAELSAAPSGSPAGWEIGVHDS
eukprot:tig00021072_g17990.t1